MASVITEQIAELRSALDSIAPEIDSLRKFINLLERFDLSDASRQALATLLDAHVRRRDLIQNFYNPGLKLVADGYPEDIPDRVPEELIAEIEEIRDLIEELLGKLIPIPIAKALNLTAAVEPE